MVDIEDNHYQSLLETCDAQPVARRWWFKAGVAAVGGSCLAILTISASSSSTANAATSVRPVDLFLATAQPPKYTRNHVGGIDRDVNFRRSIWDETHLQEMEVDHSHRGMQRLWTFLRQNPNVTDLNTLPWDRIGLPKESKRIIKEHFHVYTSKVVKREDSQRGDGSKLVIELQDGHRVETVLIRFKARNTVCVSSQIGCAMGCKFCATGTMGIIRDLSAGEIVEQFIHASRISKLRNVVFMGMGEPLNNWKNVKLAVQAFVQVWTLSFRHVCVSTVGVTRAMRAMSDELPDVNLALSLHASNQEVRKRIVPSAAGHKIDKLMEAIDYHIAQRTGITNHDEIGESRALRDGTNKSTQGKNGAFKISHELAPCAEQYFAADLKPGASVVYTKNAATDGGSMKPTHPTDIPLIAEDGMFNFRVDVKTGGLLNRKREHVGVMIEYILIKDVNDRAEHARELVQLLHPRRRYLILNLIPYNPTDVTEEYEASEADSIQTFFEICAHGGIYTRVRQRRGDDVIAACGQLVTQGKKDKRVQQAHDIEDLVGVVYDGAAGANEQLVPTVA